MTADIRAIVEEIAFSYPWEDLHGTNVCRWCGCSWEHDDECLFLRAHAALARADTNDG